MNDSALATEALWSRFHRPILAFLSSRVGDAQTAEDLVQEVFIRAHAGIASLRDETRLAAWLFQIARNAVIDHYRSRRAPDAELEEMAAADDASPLIAEQRLAEGVATMIEELPEEYRSVLRLTELEGLTQSEAASRLGLSVTAAKSRVHRGRERLREIILDCCHVELDRHGRIVDYWERPVCCDRRSK